MVIRKREDKTKQGFWKLPLLWRKLRLRGYLFTLFNLVVTQGVGVGVGTYLRLGAYLLFLPLGWALIWGWALIRINTVLQYSSYELALYFKDTFLPSASACPKNWYAPALLSIDSWCPDPRAQDFGSLPLWRIVIIQKRISIALVTFSF